ncbi:hypothetical protein AKJ16_DCAP15566 [Drosera capensis]
MCDLVKPFLCHDAVLFRLVNLFWSHGNSANDRSVLVVTEQLLTGAILVERKTLRVIATEEYHSIVFREPCSVLGLTLEVVLPKEIQAEDRAIP